MISNGPLLCTHIIVYLSCPIVDTGLKVIHFSELIKLIEVLEPVAILLLGVLTW